MYEYTETGLINTQGPVSKRQRISEYRCPFIKYESSRRRFRQLRILHSSHSSHLTTHQLYTQGTARTQASKQGLTGPIFVHSMPMCGVDTHYVP
jgi:hypothetical protein